MARVILRMLVASLMCSMIACGPPTATPAGRTARISAAQGAPFYSDDELAALQLKVITDKDFEVFPLPAVRLAPQTSVMVLPGQRTVTLRSNSSHDYPMVFEHLRVLDGPAKDRDGWIQAGWAND